MVASHIPCYSCGKWFQDERNLWIHRREVHGAWFGTMKGAARMVTPLMSVHSIPTQRHPRPTMPAHQGMAAQASSADIVQGSVYPLANPPVRAKNLEGIRNWDAGFGQAETQRRHLRLEQMVETSCHWSKKILRRAAGWNVRSNISRNQPGIPDGLRHRGKQVPMSLGTGTGARKKEKRWKSSYSRRRKPRATR